MKTYYAKKPFEYTNSAGMRMMAHAGERVSICLRSEEKQLLKEGALKEWDEVPVEAQTMTTMTVKGEGPKVDPVLLDDEEEQEEDEQAEETTKQTASRGRKPKRRGRPRKYAKENEKQGIIR
jgi:hypothetical protein